MGERAEGRIVGDAGTSSYQLRLQCYFCEKELFSLCENSNPNAHLAEKLWGHSAAGIFGYSHLTGGYAGGQAEVVMKP